MMRQSLFDEISEQIRKFTEFICAALRFVHHNQLKNVELKAHFRAFALDHDITCAICKSFAMEIFKPLFQKTKNPFTTANSFKKHQHLLRVLKKEKTSEQLLRFIMHIEVK